MKKALKGDAGCNKADPQTNEQTNTQTDRVD